MSHYINPVLAAIDMFTKDLLTALLKKHDKKPKEIVVEVREKLMKDLVRMYTVNEPEMKNLLKLAEEQHYEEVVKALKASRTCYVALRMRSVSPLLVGQSEGPLAAIFDVGMVFDPVLGLPIIPGSSIKGAVRSFLSNLCKKDDEEQASKCRELVDQVFGSPESGVGELVFFDAYPIGVSDDGGAVSLLKADILTPHYYVGGEPVESELDAKPNPVKHVSVSEGVVFGIIAAIRSRGSRAEEVKGMIAELGKILGLGDNWVIALATFIAATLSAEGVGSRTTKGYGLLNLEGLESGAGCGP